MFLWGTGPHCPVSDMCNLPDLWAVPNVTETEGGGARVPEPPASRPGSFRGALSSLWEPSQFPSARTCSVGRPWQVHCVRDEHFRASSLGKWWDSGNQRAARKGDTVGDVLVASGTVWCLEKPTLLTLGSPSPKRPWSPPPIASHSPRMAAWGMLSEFRLKYLFVAEVSSQPLLSGLGLRTLCPPEAELTWLGPVCTHSACLWQPPWFSKHGLISLKQKANAWHENHFPAEAS